MVDKIKCKIRFCLEGRIFRLDMYFHLRPVSKFFFPRKISRCFVKNYFYSFPGDGPAGCFYQLKPCSEPQSSKTMVGQVKNMFLFARKDFSN